MIYVQDRTHVFKFKKLNGVYYEPKDAKLTFNSFRSGSFQKNLEENLRYNFGFGESGAAEGFREWQTADGSATSAGARFSKVTPAPSGTSP